MPFKPVEHPKCPKCGKSVYAAEEMNAGGYKWHKFCFKCAMCNKLLDSTNCCEHQAELYCKQCHSRKYGPKGIGFGIGAELCNKLLDSTNVAPHEAELYCKQCHGRKFGPKGVGFGLGAGALTMDDGSRFANK
ncbi:mlp/crp family protein 1 [Wuchereria bancrofti]|uniref:Cysteine-rich protein 1 n=1 Tax=Wuchereria bancrofti TaxID=6293 RepID=J9ASR6_WUCBA|nr:mlp/crp family protein 1 [Wuchereria bancrofti]